MSLSSRPGNRFGGSTFPSGRGGGVYSSAEVTGFTGVGFGHSGGPRPSRHARQILHQRAGAWVVRDRGERPGARRGTVRWQLAPGLCAERLDERAALIWSKDGTVVATVLAPVSCGLRLATRSVSPRLGSETVAEVLEIDATDALTVLTVIVPGRAHEWSVVEVTGCIRPGPCCAWRDEAGQHRISLSSLHDEPAGLDVSADLCWQIDRFQGESARDRSQEMIVASHVRSIRIRNSEGHITTPSEINGKMTVLEKVSGQWISRRVWEPGSTHG